MQQGEFGVVLTGLRSFARETSPLTHAARIRCPTFLFIADDEPAEELREMAVLREMMKQSGNPSTFKNVPTGGHYDPMIETGIPAAMGWIRALPAPKP